VQLGPNSHAQGQYRRAGTVPRRVIQLVADFLATTFKLAYITPLLKKVDLDSVDAMSFRPISNLSVLSKLLQRILARQLIDYLKSSMLLPSLKVPTELTTRQRRRF